MRHTLHGMKTRFQGFIYCLEIYCQQPFDRLYVQWYRWPNNAFARLDFNHQSLDPSGAVSIALIPHKIWVKIWITFFTNKQEPAFGWTLQIGFEDRGGNDHWGNWATWRAMPFNRSLSSVVLRAGVSTQASAPVQPSRQSSGQPPCSRGWERPAYQPFYSREYRGVFF